ncbi:hypothetical protein ACFQ2B_39715 [Streptomyces stramineus]
MASGTAPPWSGTPVPGTWRWRASSRTPPSRRRGRWARTWATTATSSGPAWTSTTPATRSSGSTTTASTSPPFWRSSACCSPSP